MDTTEETAEISDTRTIESNGPALWMADDTSIRFKPWDTEREEELAELFHRERKTLEGGRVGKRASLILQHMCASIAGHVFWKETPEGGWVEEMTQASREAVMSNLWQTDVLTAMVLLRNDALMDSIAEFPVVDPRDATGKTLIDWRGDLGTLPFNGPTDWESQLWTFEPKRPFMMRGKKVDKIVMGPLRWGSTEKLRVLDMSEGIEDLNALADSIWEIPAIHRVEPGAARVPYRRADLRRMMKPDLSRLKREYDSNTNGLDMSIEVVQHDAHGRETFSFVSSVPWYRTDFFEGTSQSSG